MLTWAYTAAGERLHRVGERLRALPAWLSVLLIYGLSRVWGFIVFAVVGQQQLRSPWGQHLDYLSFISIWDAGWYEQIAVQGYPSELPVNAAGVVQQNQWAFYPIFPQLSGAISHATGIGYYPVAATVALLAGFAAAWVIYLLFEASLKATGFTSEESPSALSMWAVALVSFLPVAPVLQVPYAESLNLVFLAGALLCLVQGRYGLLVPVAALACLSRPVGVPWVRLPACGGLRAGCVRAASRVWARRLCVIWGSWSAPWWCVRVRWCGLRLRGGLRAVWMRTPPRRRRGAVPIWRRFSRGFRRGTCTLGMRLRCC